MYVIEMGFAVSSKWAEKSMSASPGLPTVLSPSEFSFLFPLKVLVIADWGMVAGWPGTQAESEYGAEY